MSEPKFKVGDRVKSDIYRYTGTIKEYSNGFGLYACLDDNVFTNKVCNDLSSFELIQSSQQTQKNPSWLIGSFPRQLRYKDDSYITVDNQNDYDFVITFPSADLIPSNKLSGNYTTTYSPTRKTVSAPCAVSTSCDCGAQKARTTHSHWCSAYESY